MNDFIYTFIPIFVAMDVGGLIPVYLSLTGGLPLAKRRRIALTALATGFLIAAAFIAAGQLIFRILGITASDFQIAGGLLLLVLAVVEILRTTSKDGPAGENVGVVPLGTPLIVGPAVLTTLLILVPEHGYPLTLAALVANFLVAWLAFKYCQYLVAWVGANGLRALSKVISLFLAAIAVSMIRRGLGQ